MEMSLMQPRQRLTPVRLPYRFDACWTIKRFYGRYSAGPISIQGSPLTVMPNLSTACQKSGCSVASYAHDRQFPFSLSLD